MPKNIIRNFIDYRKDIERHFCETFGLKYKIYSIVSAIMSIASFIYMIWFYVSVYKLGRDVKRKRESKTTAYKYVKDDADEQIFEE